ncbi:pleiotropic drug resistance protein 3-like protein isoform X2, partial [Tanacetum coccineum]
HNQQSLFNVFGSMFTAVLFGGANNCASAIAYVSVERTVLYRERFSGMYASLAYAFAQKIPKWWIWLYYLTPTSWTLNALLTSQFGDVKKNILVFGETRSVEAFLREYFGYHHEHLPLVFVLLALYPIGFASLFACCIAKLNFQRR